MWRFSRLLLLSVLACFMAHADDVRVWQGTLTLPTYEEGPPDPNPPFDIFETSRFNYPYTIRDNLTSRRSDHIWRALFIENEYLKCTVLPDIGGHLYTCMDKLSGQPMFYANPSIKKAQIGYRGAWAAFGIEFNFPVSHNWVSMSPIDFAFGKHDDGSASITVGNIDRVYGMEWSVELVLRPNSTVLEEKVALSNRSDARHRFYWWNNAGVQVWDDSQIQYPMRYAASHGFTEVQPWPVDSTGKDLSIIRNQTEGPVSLFVHGSREPFMAVWHPHTNTGLVHFADYAELPGKKIWSWGADADGLDWRRALSDNDSAYVEVQAGLFRNQETYAFLEPRQTIRFSEYWTPARETGAIARANLFAVVNLTTKANKLVAALNVNQPVPHASIRLLDGAQVLFEKTLDLTPEQTWNYEIPIPVTQHHYTFELRDAAGAVLLRHTEGEYDWTPRDEVRVGPQPAYEMPAPFERSEDDWLQLGTQQELNGDLLGALNTYEQALAKFPNSFALHKAAGRLASSLLRYEDAVNYLAPIHQRNPSDPEISYYLGAAYEGIGEEQKARDCYEHAYRLPPFRAAAGLRLAELSARQQRLDQAERYLNRSMKAAPDDLRIAEELVAVGHALDKTDEAGGLAEQWLKRCPLSNFLREESGTPDLPHLGADPDRVLNIAAQYMRLAFYSSALRVLSRKYPASSPDESEPGAVLPQNHVLVAYFRAYCKEKLGQSAAGDYKAASQLSTQYAFPNRAETMTVLKAALRANPSDGTAHYLLGTFLFSRGLTDAALNEWSAAAKFAPSTPVLFADIGRALLNVKRDPKGALAAFRDGVASDSKNPVLYFGMDQALSILNGSPRDRLEALERYPEIPQMPSGLVYELALNRAEAGDFDGAIELFHNRFFAREEGGTNVRQVWVEVKLQEAIAQERAGHCDSAAADAASLGSETAGLAFTHDGLEPVLNSARTQYLLGMMYSRCNRSEEAQLHFQNAAARTDSAQIYWAWQAAKKLRQPMADWQQKLEHALLQARKNRDTSGYRSFWIYTEALLERALGRTQEANVAFEEALLAPDAMLSYHLTRLARFGAIPE